MQLLGIVAQWHLESERELKMQRNNNKTQMSVCMKRQQNGPLVRAPKGEGQTERRGGEQRIVLSKRTTTSSMR